MVYVNHALLGFYLCQSRIHEYDGFNNVDQIYSFSISL